MNNIMRHAPIQLYREQSTIDSVWFGEAPQAIYLFQGKYERCGS